VVAIATASTSSTTPDRHKRRRELSSDGLECAAVNYLGFLLTRSCCPCLRTAIPRDRNARQRDNRQSIFDVMLTRGYTGAARLSL
jgi:hypothetical protein